MSSARAPRRAALLLLLAGWMAGLAAAAPQAAAPIDAKADAEFFQGLPVYRVRLAENPPENSFEAAFRVAGAEHGRTVVLLHGLSSTSAVYGALARELAGDFRVILIDLPGYGDSFTPKPISYDYERMTARLLAILRAADALEGAVLIGHSTGGALAWHLDLEKECRPAGLVLIDAVTVPFKLAPVIDIAFRMAGGFVTAGPIFNLIGNPVLMGLISRGSSADITRRLPPIRDDQEPMFTTPARLRVNHQWVDQMLAEEVVAAWAPRLADVDSPTLLVWGTEDGVLRPEVMTRALSSIPQARAVMIEAAGHSPMRSHPSQVAELIREFASGLAFPDRPRALAPEAVPANPAALAALRPESSGRMIHFTLSLTGVAGSALLDAATVRLKWGYYAPGVPSQSGSAGLFLEARGSQDHPSLTTGGQLELVWEKWGGLRIEAGWEVAGRGHPSLLRIGYVPSYAPRICLGVLWRGVGAKPALFVTVELEPKLYR